MSPSEARVIAAAKRWFQALSLTERADASYALTHAVKALLVTESRQAKHGRCQPAATGGTTE